MDFEQPHGAIVGSTYSEARSILQPSGQATLAPDGVVEAANAKERLFSFDRTRAISSKSAAEIASAAKALGQNDDITVVTVRRSA